MFDKLLIYALFLKKYDSTYHTNYDVRKVLPT